MSRQCVCDCLSIGGAITGIPGNCSFWHTLTSRIVNLMCVDILKCVQFCFGSKQYCFLSAIKWCVCNFRCFECIIRHVFSENGWCGKIWWILDKLHNIYSNPVYFLFAYLQYFPFYHYFKSPLCALSNLSVSLHSAKTTHLQRHHCNRPIVKKFKMQFQKVCGQIRVL